MELDEIKVKWKETDPILYSNDELDSIYHIKKRGVLESLKRFLSWDLIGSIVIAAVFITILQVLALKTSNFWSLCLTLLTVQHIIFYKFQNYLLRKYARFEKNVFNSISLTLAKLRKILWFYRIWPACFSLILYLIYISQFTHEWPFLKISILGSSLVILTAVLSNIITAVSIRRHSRILAKLSEDLQDASSS